MRSWLIFLTIFALVSLWPLNLSAQEDEDEYEDNDISEDMEDSDEDSDEDFDAPVTEDEVAAEEEADEKAASRSMKSRGVETYWGDTALTEVEKGFFIDTRLGALMYLGSGYGEYAMAGMMFGVGMGYDIVPKLFSMELDALFNFHGADILEDDGTRMEKPKVRGDFSALRVPLAFNFQYFTTKRVELYASLTGGLNYIPQAIDGFDDNGDSISGKKIDFYGGVRTGVEYYTGLRHFSIGLELEFDYIFSGSMALAVAPTMKYTF